MSYTYLLDAGEESSAESFSDIPVSVLLRLSLTVEKSCSKDSGTKSCQDSQSGMTCEPSTASPGKNSLMSSAVDFPAQILAAPGLVKESTENKADSGKKWPESFATLDRHSCSWKTRQYSLLGGLEPFLETWPRWGLMQNGECFPLPMLSGLMEHRAWITSESESGLRLPTVTKFDGACGDLEGKEYDGQTRHAMKLIQGLKRLQTPTVQDAHGRDRHNQPDGSVILSLLGQCRRLPTVMSSSKTGGRKGLDGGSGARSMMTETEVKELTGGNLNPEWIEWFMGWPIDWSDVQPLAMDKFQQWLSSHGKR